MTLALSCAEPSKSNEQRSKDAGQHQDDTDQRDARVDGAADSTNGDAKGPAVEATDGGENHGDADTDWAGDADGATTPPFENINPCDPEVFGARPREALFEPPEIQNVPLSNDGGELTLYSSTLTQATDGPQLLAGICNEGDAPLCGAAIQVEFYNQANELLGTASGGVHGGELHSFSQSPTPISCLAPGQAGMAAVTDFPGGLVVENVASIVHSFPAFQIDDAVPIPSLEVSELRVARTLSGQVFAGTVTNIATTSISNPAVSVFPLNAEGRPVGYAVSVGDLEVPPGGTWSFLTGAVRDAGTTRFAIASGSLALPE